MSRPTLRQNPPGKHCGAVAPLVLLLLLTLTGCTSAAYKSAPKSTPAPVPINLPSTEPPFEALVHTVIVYRGPGSWKRDAYWDEYVVTIANRGDGLIRVESASLTDFQNQVTTAGENPWALESTSRSLADKSFGLVKSTALQIGGGVTVITAGVGVGAALTAATLSGVGAGAFGAAVGGVLTLPAFIGGTIYSNISNRHSIEREFDRRRLPLPATLVPGQAVQGSLFFRISPGPRRLTLKCQVDDTPRDLVIDLSPLAGMHLKSTTVAPGPASDSGARPNP